MNETAAAEHPLFGAHARGGLRAKTLLEGAWRVAWPIIGSSLGQAVTDLETDLFRHAERAPNVNEQNLCFESLRELRTHREAFVQAVRDGVQRSLRHLLDPAVPKDQLATEETGARRRSELKLVDPVHLEEILVLTEVATRAEMRCGDELQSLAYRLAVIVGGAPEEPDELALGPRRLCASVRVAADCFEVVLAHRHALYRRIEKSLFADVTSLYAAINRFLASQNVLAHLQLAPRRVVVRGSAPRPSEPPVATQQLRPPPPVAGSVPDPAAAPEAQSAPAWQPARGVPAQPPAAPKSELARSVGSGATSAPPASDTGHPPSAPSAPGEAFSSLARQPDFPTEPDPPAESGDAPPASATALDEARSPRRGPTAGTLRERPAHAQGPAMQAFRRFMEATSREGAAPAERPAAERPAAVVAPPAAPPPAASFGGAEMPDFDALRELLAGHRGGAGERGGDSTRTVVPAAELHAALGDLQLRPPERVMSEGRMRVRSVADVKRELLAQLRSRGDGTPAKLAPADSDAIDLIGFLFEHLTGDRPQANVAQDLLARLQVPMIRLALQDKTFFTQRQHPARQLLNNLLETADTWVDDDSLDQSVADRLRWVVDRVAREYEQDSSVFARLGEDLSRHVGSLKRKAEVSERHHVEAARGRERLDLAKAAAGDAVQQKLAHANPPPAVRTLLESAWTDATALSFLRLGQDHPGSRERLDFVDRLLRLFGGDLPLGERRFELQRLHAEFQDGLGAIGYHEEAIGSTWKELSRLAEEGEAAAATDQVRELVAQQPRLGGERRDGEAGRDALRSLLPGKREPRLPLGPKEQEMVERIRHLPFGTWFEFSLNQQGDISRRKLCWFSPLTGRCLFVNARGAKVGERSIDDLARDLVRGNVKVVEEVRESLMDRAWKGILSMLRGAGIGGGQTPQPQAG